MARQSPAVNALAELFHALPTVAFYIKDPHSRFMRANSLAIDTPGRTREADVLGRTDADFHPPALATAYIAEDQRVMALRSAIIGQAWLVYHDHQRPVWYLSSKTPLLDGAGNVIGLAGAMYPMEQAAAAERHFQELSPVVDYIEQHYSQPISMEAMAALAGISATHFNRRFRQILRMSPTEYLCHVRMQIACRALARSRRAIAEIAFATGFCDQSHFTRAFRQYAGLTPAAYRKRFQGADVNSPL